MFYIRQTFQDRALAYRFNFVNACFYASLLKKFIAGFEQAIQGYAIHVLSLTYQKIPRTVLAEVCF